MSGLGKAADAVTTEAAEAGLTDVSALRRRYDIEAAHTRLAGQWVDWAAAKTAEAVAAWCVTGAALEWSHRVGYTPDLPVDGPLGIPGAVLAARGHPTAAAELVSAHSPLWWATPTAAPSWGDLAAAAAEHIPPGAPTGVAGLSAEWVGDLWQRLSEESRLMRALVQTPGFVADFILDRNLDAAAADDDLCPEGWDEVTLIDPAAGTGHFLTRAVSRIVDRCSLTGDAAAAHALRHVSGIEIDGHTAAFCRWRMTLAALGAAHGGPVPLADHPMPLARCAWGDALLPWDDPLQPDRRYSYPDAAALEKAMDAYGAGQQQLDV